MEETIHALAAHRGGYMFRADLIDHGFRDPDIRAAMRAGVLTRLRHGTYASTTSLRSLSAEERHVLIAYSVIDRLGTGLALSHHSAALAHDRRSYGLDLGVIHLTRLDGRHGRQEAGVAFHVGEADEDQLVRVDGRLCVPPARAAFESACLSPTESAMVTLSAMLNSGLCSRAELDEMGRRMERWPGSRRARLALRLADAGCESVGESRSLYMFWREGVPRPDTQVVVRTASGVEVARTDFGWLESCHVGEFDGMVKYGRLNPYAEDPGRIIIDEKRREDRVRAERLGMSRWTWSDLAPSVRARTAAGIVRSIQQSRALFGHGRTHIPLYVRGPLHRATNRFTG